MKSTNTTNEQSREDQSEGASGRDALPSVRESTGENWSALTGHDPIPGDSTVDDDIMADLDMAERTMNTRKSSSPPFSRPLSRADHSDLEMDLEAEILRSVPDTPPVTSNDLLGSSSLEGTHKVVHKRSSSSVPVASSAPSPHPSGAGSAPKKTTKAAAKPKGKAQTGGSKTAAKKKSETTKGKGGNTGASGRGKAGGDADWAWGGATSGRAAAAAATNALLATNGYSEELGGELGQGTGKDSKAWEADNEEEEEEDKRLYCVCRERYDNRFMLGCDKWVALVTFQCSI
jgi:hypothetical protein